MPAAGLLALLDDLASLLDDVAVMSKLATKKTMAIAGDDLAVGAEALVGLDPKRELPIVWAVTKGSLVNKAWLVPLALALSYFAPMVLTPLLMIGGAFLCYEGVHKLIEKLGPKHQDAPGQAEAAPRDPQDVERERVKGAVRTDLILSAEIVVIALNALAEYDFGRRTAALVIVAFGLTFAIYGLIAAIVKADDLGLHLVQRGGFQARIGRGLLVAMPPFMKLIGVVGTIAMFLVGGGIIEHGIPPLEHAVKDLIGGFSAPETGFYSLLKTVAVLVIGVITGLVALGLAAVLGPVVKRLRKAPAA
jgi:predicted DNA repair protein MutK